MGKFYDGRNLEKCEIQKKSNETRKPFNHSNTIVKLFEITWLCWNSKITKKLTCQKIDKWKMKKKTEKL